MIARAKAIVCLVALATSGALAEEAPPTSLSEEEPTAVSLDPSELRQAGMGGDPIRAVDVIPGVSPPGPDADPVVRGQAPPDVGTHLFGIRHPLPLHSGGLRSAFLPVWVDGVTLHTAPPVSYGGLAGAAIDVTLRPPRVDRLRGGGALDPLSATAFAETPLGERGSAVGVGVRRTLVDVWGPARRGQQAAPSLLDAPVYGSLLPESADASFAKGPSAWDYHVLGATPLGAGEDVLVVFHGTTDAMALRFDSPAEADPTLRGTAARSAAFHGVLARWRRARTGSRVANLLTLAAGTLADDFSVTHRAPSSLRPIEVATSEVELRVRDEVRVGIDRNLALEGGLEVAARQRDLQISGPPPPIDGEPFRPPGADVQVSGRRTNRALEPAAWLSTPMRVTDGWLIEPGIRAAYDGTIAATIVDPRFHTRAQILAGTYVRAHTGLYSRGPELFRSSPATGTMGLAAERVAMAGGGVERWLAPVVISLDAYFHVLSERAVPVENESARGYVVVSQGEGTTRGVELALRVPPSPVGSGRVSYSLSKSVRDDGAGPGHTFSSDRRHVINAAGRIAVGDGWNLGARFRLASGVPVPEVVAAVYDADRDAYRPTDVEISARRLPFFHQLDLRVDRSFVLPVGTLSAYVDVANVYDASNVVGRVCSFDFDVCADVAGVPFLPTAGLEGSF